MTHATGPAVVRSAAVSETMASPQHGEAPSFWPGLVICMTATAAGWSVFGGVVAVACGLAIAPVPALAAVSGVAAIGGMTFGLMAGACRSPEHDGASDTAFRPRLVVSTDG